MILYNLLKKAEEDPWILTPTLEKYPEAACRGFFDAEGWVEVERYTVAAGNTNPNIIDMFKELLEKLDIDCRVHPCRRQETFISPRTGRLYRRNSEYIFVLAIYEEKTSLGLPRRSASPSRRSKRR